MLQLDTALEFDPNKDSQFFSRLPEHSAVCLIEPIQEGAEPFLIRTAGLRRRMQRLLGTPDPATKRLNLRKFAKAVRFRATGSAFEQLITYYHQARQLFPKRYRTMMRLRPAAVLKVSLRNAYPRCYVTRHIAVDAQGIPFAGAYYGPFASRRSAEAFSEKFLDLFKVRRCQIKIRRDPAFPGCLYSEMKMCLAPCFAGCTKEEYDVEVGKLVAFLETSGNSLRASLEQERETASADLDFEKAAAIHKKLEKFDDVLRGQPELARKIQDLDAVILQRAPEAHSVALFAVRGGRMAEPFVLQFGETSAPRSAEETVRNYLQAVMSASLPPASPRQSSSELGEHLWLLARWFYSNPREGEIFFRDKDWPYRRILRGCTRLLAAPEEQPGEPGKQESKSEGKP